MVNRINKPQDKSKLAKQILTFITLLFIVVVAYTLINFTQSDKTIFIFRETIKHTSIAEDDYKRIKAKYKKSSTEKNKQKLLEIEKKLKKLKLIKEKTYKNMEELGLKNMADEIILNNKN